MTPAASLTTTRLPADGTRTSRPRDAAPRRTLGSVSVGPPPDGQQGLTGLELGFDPGADDSDLATVNTELSEERMR